MNNFIQPLFELVLDIYDSEIHQSLKNDKAYNETCEKILEIDSKLEEISSEKRDMFDELVLLIHNEQSHFYSHAMCILLSHLIEFLKNQSVLN